MTLLKFTWQSTGYRICLVYCPVSTAKANIFLYI